VSPALDLSFPPELIDLVTALLDDLDPAAIHETGPDDAPAWRVFFTEPAARDDAADALAARFAGRGLTVARFDVPDEDWAARSQAGLRAVRVGRVLVAPPWDTPQNPDANDALVIIQPSMGFGTGHHETTRLCLALLQEIDCRVEQVLDVGTGSGVLALAAAALGAQAVDGIDTDPDAVANAVENLALNPSLARKATIEFSVADLRPAQREPDAPGLLAGDERPLSPPKPISSARARNAGRPAPVRADLVLANLTGALLVAAAPDLLRRAGPGATLIVSGFQLHEATAVLNAFASDADLVTRRSEDVWQAALLRRR
jgi:ribosomal protein L11 methyltransferase